MQTFAKSRHIGSGLAQKRGSLVGRSLVKKSPFSSGAARLAVEPPVAPRPPKRHQVRNFFLTTTLLLTGATAGSVYYALQNDDFYYKLTTYIPFSSTLVDTVDDFLFQQRMASKHPSKPANGTSNPAGQIASVPVDSTSKAIAYTTGSPSQPASTVQERVKHAADAASGAAHNVVDDVKDLVTPGSSNTTTTRPADAGNTTVSQPKSGAKPAVAPTKEAAVAPAPSKKSENFSPSAAPATSKAVGKEHVLPDVSVPLHSVDIADIDPALTEVANAIAVCSRAHDADLKNDAFFANLARSVESASQSIRRERDTLKQKYEKEVQTKSAVLLQEADREYLGAKMNLVESYNNRLQLALDAVTRKAVAQANNKIAAQYVELQKQTNGKIVEYVEQERDGRLSQIAELKKDIETLQEAMLSSGRILESEDGVVSFFVELGNLQRILNKQDVIPLKPYIEAMTKSLPSDPLVKAVADSISPSVKRYGVLSHPQLAARFNLIEPKIRQASLAPPDAGIAGHLGSLAASQLLVRKEGLPEGEDVESIIARTQTYLQQGDILHAVAEVNSLQGWPKKIAADWLDEGRKRSEVEFLVQVLSEEGRLWSISKNKK